MERIEKEFENILLPWLGKTMKFIDLYITDRLDDRGFDLTKAQLLLLRRLKDQNGCPQHNLAAKTNRDRASLARLLTTMEKKNLVARIPSEIDHRINLIHITKYGEKTLTEAWPLMKSILLDLQQGIKDDEISQSIAVMKKIILNMNIGKSVAPQIK